ncbi:MAG: cytochrome c biogenesis protein CcsA [Zetaproteobacteria bacterium]|nr:cytochrome c biogenesis protein CcsA [Zetaproteobacteria bacterium]
MKDGDINFKIAPHPWMICSLPLLLISWAYGLFIVPTDIHQGEVYRILFLHVSCAINAFAISAVLFVCSVQCLWKNNTHFSYWGLPIAETGLFWTIFTLITGSIWGKPTWGVWWTWDARLTTTFILALMYAGFMVLWHAADNSSTRNKSCAILGILIFADVPIIYKSVSWWRTLHQPPSILRTGGATMSTPMLMTLLAVLCCTLLVSAALIRYRAQNRQLESQLEQQMFELESSQKGEPL